MVRGFALFGVLLVNMYNFGASWPIWTGEVDRLAFAAKRFLFETKSWRLFSFLFGLGFSFQLLTARRQQLPFFARYLRRIIGLFCIGAVHTLLYDGDILKLYAELGLVLILFVRVPPRVMLTVALVLLSIFPVGGLVQGLWGQPEPDVTPEVIDIDEWLERREQTQHPYAVGSIWDVMAFNASAIWQAPLDNPISPESNISFFAMFLLGLYAGVRRIFQDIEHHLRLVRSVCAWGLGVGLVGMVIERVVSAGWDYDVFGPHGRDPLLEFVGDSAFVYGSTALSLGYAATIVLMARSPRWRSMVTPFAPVGKMALTVYLTQSLIFTTIFYGYGLGLGLWTGPVAVTSLAVAIFAGQIVLCRWWLRRHRFGPAEWAWRTATYLQLPRMKFVQESPVPRDGNAG